MKERKRTPKRWTEVVICITFQSCNENSFNAIQCQAMQYLVQGAYGQLNFMSTVSFFSLLILKAFLVMALSWHNRSFSTSSYICCWAYDEFKFTKVHNKVFFCNLNFKVEFYSVQQWWRWFMCMHAIALVKHLEWWWWQEEEVLGEASEWMWVYVCHANYAFENLKLFLFDSTYTSFCVKQWIILWINNKKEEKVLNFWRNWTLTKHLCRFWSNWGLRNPNH